MSIHFSSLGKENRYLDLINSVQHCDLCEKLCNVKKGLSSSNGSLNSKLFFINNFPYMDQDNFEMLINNAGWEKEYVFISNALLCSPKKNEESNHIPSSTEIENCSIYLQMLINLIQPEVIVSLGSIALKALYYISPHNIELDNNVGEKINWYNRILIPLYDPSQLDSVHRSIPKQRADFISLAKFVDPIKGIKFKKKATQKARYETKESSDINLMQVILAIVSNLNELTYFKLAKLLYLVDLTALERFGETLTGSLYLRQENGPWPPSLPRVINKMNGFEISYINKDIPVIRTGLSPRIEVNLNEEHKQLILEVINKYGHMSNTNIKVAVYRSFPMRYVLKQENLKRDMRKVPIIYMNKTIIDLDKK